MSIRRFGHCTFPTETSRLILVSLICLSGRCIGQTYDGFGYSVSGADITVTGYTGAAGAVTIPSAIPGVDGTVTAIVRNPKDPFAWGASTSIAIPSSVTYIADLSFMEDSYTYSGLTSITVDPQNAVYSSIDGVLFDKGALTLLECPGALAGSYAIPSGVTSIAVLAFGYCSDLTSVTIADSVTNIGLEAFSNCYGLTNLTIGSGVTSIGNAAFAFSGLTSVTIPNGVTSIQDSAFNSCTSLINLTLGNNVTAIGDGAFAGCSNLTSVTLGRNVTAIGTDAFENCTSLTSAYFRGDAPSTIDFSAFEQTASGFTIYYPRTATGWTTPTWLGYPSKPYDSPPPGQRPVLSLMRGSGAVTPTLSYILPGASYQLQVSTDLSTWSNAGPAFIATNTSETCPQPFAMTSSSQLFFRLKSAP